MPEMSRRHFLFFSALAPFLFKAPVLAADDKNSTSAITYPRTTAVLQEAFRDELTAYRHYAGYTSQALTEKYPNIAYLFHAFSFSEKIHADNYKRILAALGHEAAPVQIQTDVRNTKANLQKAAQNELKKIRTTYPDLLRKLEVESYDEAIVSCMYSWKSHKQHEEKVKEIAKYSGMFFSSLSGKIEGLNPDYYVCMVCGSTIDDTPQFPCTICNKPRSNYLKIERPVQT